MMSPSKIRQRGVSLIGMLFIAGFLAIVGTIGAQVFPTFIEYLAVKKAAKKAAVDGGDTVAAVRAAFDRAAEVDNISSVQGTDMTVTKVGDRVVVSFAYQKEIHLAGPAYLVMKYAGSSAD